MAIDLIANLVANTDMVYPFKIYFQTSEDIAEFNSLVAEEQYTALIDLMGDEIYNEFQEALAGTPAQKWIDLRDGKTFESCFYGVERNWRGLKQMLVPFMFSKWVDRNETFVTNTGSMVFENTNSRELTKFELKQLSNKAFNEYVMRSYIAYDFMLSENVYETNGCIYYTKQIKRGIVNKSAIR